MKPSVGLFTYSVKPRGSVVHAACLAEALMDAGADVTLYALAKGSDRFFRPLRCPLVLFPAAPAPAEPDKLIEQRIGELQAALEHVADHHDVYHAEDCLTASALLTTELAGLRPVVRTVHHVERFESAFLAACQQRSIERADLVLSVSELTCREVLAEFGRSSRVVHNGVDLGRFASSDRQRAFVRRLGISDGDVVVLSVGGVEERKNTLRMLAALIPVLHDDPRVVWVVAGGASIWDHSELERRFDGIVATLPPELARRIVRSGPLEEDALAELYARSDVLFAASLHEGFGLCVLEALASETAVVAAKRAPFTEFLDERVALLVDPEDTTSMTRALRDVTTDAALRARLTIPGKERARAFSWSKAAHAHLDAYFSIMPAARRRAPASTGSQLEGA